MSKRELDLGRLLQKVGRRIEDEGQATSQRFHDWKRAPRLPLLPPPCPACDGEGRLYAFGGIGNAVPCGDCDGTGDGARPNGGDPDGKQNQQAARLAAEWTQVRLQLDALATRALWLMDQAKAADTALVRDWTPAQAEAEGWCRSHWRIKEQVPIACRPTGEPYYRGLCRDCGKWPGGEPPIEVLKAWRDGRGVKVRAS